MSVKTLLWLGQPTFSANLAAELAKFASYHANGFMSDNRYATLPDSVQNLGVGRLPGDTYTAFETSQASVIASAIALGITDTFFHLQMDSYFPVAQFGSHNKWDIFDASAAATFAQSFANQATFAHLIGMTGVWLDVEPYSWQNLYSPEQDPAMPAYGMSAASVAQRFFTLGESAMGALLAVYPGIQLLISPDAPLTSSSRYLHLPDFIAGMIAAAAAASANGIVFATERVQSWTTSTAPGYARMVTNIMGSTPASVTNGIPSYTTLKASLQSFDAQNNTDSWDWHLAHDSVALGTQPYRTDGSDMWPGDNLAQLAANLVAERAACSVYTYVYDNGSTGGAIANWDQIDPAVPWPISSPQTTQPGTPGAGLVLGTTLPPLSGSSAVILAGVITSGQSLAGNIVVGASPSPPPSTPFVPRSRLTQDFGHIQPGSAPTFTFVFRVNDIPLDPGAAVLTVTVDHLAATEMLAHAGEGTYTWTPTLTVAGVYSGTIYAPPGAGADAQPFVFVVDPDPNYP